VVHPKVPANTLREFIALAKSQPGKLNYASSGQGTPYHMAGELFKSMTGIDVVHVPYRNSGEARTGVISGQVQMMIDAVPTMAPNVSAGQVRALATTGKTRSSVLPDVPTADEAGVPGYEATIWLGLMAPAGTPKPVIDKLNAAVNEVVKRPDIVKLWKDQGAIPMSMTVEEFDKFLRGDIVKWGNVVKTFAEKPQ
jgi:tripartite-type tricarboxylate transporter receptor subunit TctC